MDLHTDDFDYHLPADLIAQQPAPEREASRLLVLHRANQEIQHDVFSSINRYLRSGDVLVANRSKVIPARLTAKKRTGGEVEILLLRRLGTGCWKALARPSRRLQAGAELHFPGHPLHARLESSLGEGEWTVKFEADGDVEDVVREAGQVPLPPYIRPDGAPLDRYQTVYADQDGSVAAPTAGLHFSETLLQEIKSAGVDVQYVTLHIGLGTFRPVVVERVRDHLMHAEWGEVPPHTAEAVNAAHDAGGRVVAVGTTTVRLLESAAQNGRAVPFAGDTDRFIYPGYRFTMIDAMVTNFHLPRSTLLMMVSAFAGRDFVMRAYEEAVRSRYRFYSFGDAMLIL